MEATYSSEAPGSSTFILLCFCFVHVAHFFSVVCYVLLLLYFVGYSHAKDVVRPLPVMSESLSLMLAIFTLTAYQI